jgi:ABC-type nitrate/sulfonate/bicarbonate transport system permease component
VQLFVMLGLAGLWEAVARSGAASPLVFPSLLAVGEAVWRSVASGELFFHLGMTATEIVVAFALAATSGVAAGLLAGLLPPVRGAIQPLLLLTFSIPMVALVPFFTIVFGLGMLSKVIFAAIYAFFPVCMNTLAGVRGLDPTLLPLARSLGARPWQVVSKFLFPACLPAILAGLEGGMSLCVIGVLATEMLASLFGMGYLLARAMTGIETAKVYGLVLVTLALAYAANRAIHAVRLQVRKETRFA